MRTFLQVAQKATLIFIALTFSFSALYAQNWDQIIKATAGDRNSKPSGARSIDDSYGGSISISGDYAVVGAAREDEDVNGQNTITNAGAAYVLHYTDGKWKQVKKLCASVRAVDNAFGAAVSISDDYIIVGAFQENWISPGVPAMDNAGAAYIFRKNEGGEDNWGLVQRLSDLAPDAYNQFGVAVSISGEYAVVGAHLESEDASEGNTVSAAGAAYLFKKDYLGTNNWGQLKKIVASDREIGDLFGWSLSLSGDYLIVGAYFDDELIGGVNTSSVGSAYIFRKNQGGTDNWGQQKKILNPEPAEYGSFASSVAISGEYVIISSPRQSSGAPLAGAAYIFKRDNGGANNWGLTKKLVASSPGEDDNFGSSVAISNGYAIVGANGDDQNSIEQNTLINSGSAYIFKTNLGGTDNWGQVKKITASFRKEYNLFGHAVAISGAYAMVSTPYEYMDESESNKISGAGAAYFYHADNSGTDNWGFERKMIMEESTPDDNFGYSVAISGNYAIVGSPYEDENVNGIFTVRDAGAAYIFYNSGGNWLQVKKVTASTRWAHDHFGWSVSIDGQYAVVGAPQGKTNVAEQGYLENAGAAYIFGINEGGAGLWGQVKKIVPANRAGYNSFGISVSISGNVLVVGAPYTDAESVIQNFGSAYIFSKDQGGSNKWGQVKELTAPLRVFQAYFGGAVSISGNYVIVGAEGDSYNQRGVVIDNTGTAYIYKKDEGGQNIWGHVRSINSSHAAANDHFGVSVSISGVYAIVGAHMESEDVLEANTLSNSGSAYIFKDDEGGADKWGQVKKLTAADRAQDDYFGYAVSISGNYAIVGAYQDNENAEGYSSLDNSGSAYIFKKDQGSANNWGQLQKITALNRHFSSNFGRAVAIGDAYIVAGAPFENRDANEFNPLSGTGAAYFFHTSGSLPVKLQTFTAVKNERQTLLKWSTSNETNTSNFEVQRSADARSWETIGSRAAAVESQQLTAYTFTDDKPLEGNNLYRLKMVDIDDSFAYSSIRSLSFEIAGSTVLYPNPVSDKFYVSPAALAKVSSLRMMNAVGQVVAQTAQLTREGITTTHLAPGIYIVQIGKTDGTTEVQKMIVVR